MPIRPAIEEDTTPPGRRSEHRWALRHELDAGVHHELAVRQRDALRSHTAEVAVQSRLVGDRCWWDGATRRGYRGRCRSGCRKKLRGRAIPQIGRIDVPRV